MSAEPTKDETIELLREVLSSIADFAVGLATLAKSSPSVRALP
jgi:hypothetical protein